ncbi:MAG: TetR/AcrR family transcriptional regulator [Bacilli bacterium]
MPRTENVNREIRDERREQILAAAAKVFARNGYVGTRIDDIAAAAAISKGLIYHYFGSKETIFNTLVGGAARGTIHLYRQALEMSGGAAARLRWLVERIVDGLAEQPDMFMVVMQASVSDATPQEAREQVSAMVLETRNIMTRFIAAGQRDGEIVQGDPEHLAFVLGSCIEGLAVALVMSTPPPTASMTDLLIRLLTPAGSQGGGR